MSILDGVKIRTVSLPGMVGLLSIEDSTLRMINLLEHDDFKTCYYLTIPKIVEEKDALRFGYYVLGVHGGVSGRGTKRFKRDNWQPVTDLSFSIPKEEAFSELQDFLWGYSNNLLLSATVDILCREGDFYVLTNKLNDGVTRRDTVYHIIRDKDTYFEYVACLESQGHDIVERMVLLDNNEDPSFSKVIHMTKLIVSLTS